MRRILLSTLIKACLCGANNVGIQIIGVFAPWCLPARRQGLEASIYLLLSSKKGIHKFFFVEQLQVLQSFPQTDVFDRDPELI